MISLFYVINDITWFPSARALGIQRVDFVGIKGGMPLRKKIIRGPKKGTCLFWQVPFFGVCSGAAAE